MYVQVQNSVEVLKSRVPNAVMTVKRDMLGRVWCKANYRRDIYRVVKGAQLGILRVYYSLTDIHANSRQIMSLRTFGEELDHWEDVVL
jgi:hypothetical protein